MLVISVYLLYTVYEADYEIRRDSSFYHALGVPFDASDKDIKSRFRRLAAQFHPDKAGKDSGDYFIHLQAASDALQNNPMRFAYERFGPTVSRWVKCKTMKDYVVKGVLSTILPYYAMAAASIYVFTLLGYLTMGQYYRWLILATFFIFELSICSRPTFPTYLTSLNAVLSRLTRHPPLVPFQLVSLLRRIGVTVYIALTQIGPVLKAHMGVVDDTREQKALQEMLLNAEAISKQLNEDASRLLDMEMAPYKGDREAASDLQDKMREWLVQNTIRADPMVKDALGTSFRRRRIDAPAEGHSNK